MSDREEILKEFKTYREQTFSQFKQTGTYYDNLHATSQQGISDAQDAACALSVDTESRLTDVEDALCELTK